MAQNLVLVSLLLLLLAIVVSGASPGDGSECQRQCGNVAVPYPFGISHKGSALDNSSNIGCFKGSPFNLTCNVTYRLPKLFWGGLEVTNISLDTAEMTIQALMNFECANSTVSMARGNNSGYLNLNGDWPFTFSQRNLFVTVGCDIT